MRDRASTGRIVGPIFWRALATDGPPSLQGMRVDERPELGVASYSGSEPADPETCEPSKVKLNLSVLSCVALLGVGCTQVAAPVCETASDAGEPSIEARLRVVNLGREAVSVRLEGADAGTPVMPLESKNYVGHVTLIKQRGTIEGRSFLPDGGTEPVALPFEFDATSGERVTLVVRETTPARISTNLTVAKQTQGATFGEKVNQGLAGVEIEGGVDTGGDCTADFSAPAGTAARTSLRDDTSTDCDASADRYFTRPAGVSEEAIPYFVHGQDELLVAWVEGEKVNAGLHAAGSVLSQGASLLGGALPGGAVISAAVSSLYVLNAHGSHQPASVSLEGVVVAENVAPGALVRVKPSAVAAASRRARAKVIGDRDTGVVAELSVGGTVQTLTLGGQAIGPCRPPYLCDFLQDEDTLLTVSDKTESSATVLKSQRKGWDGTVKGGSRLFVAATTSTVETRGCVAVVPTDDTCVMGAAHVSTLAGSGGGAAAASYAATGRLLFPPAKTPAKEPVRFVIEEQLNDIAQRFVWLDPPGLTPSPDATTRGFAILAAGTSADATAGAQRALYFVDTSASPWILKGPALSVAR